MIGAVASNHGCHHERTAPLDSDHAFSFTKRGIAIVSHYYP